MLPALAAFDAPVWIITFPEDLPTVVPDMIEIAPDGPDDGADSIVTSPLFPNVPSVLPLKIPTSPPAPLNELPLGPDESKTDPDLPESPLPTRRDIPPDALPVLPVAILM
jgi:hypothetical protein